MAKAYIFLGQGAQFVGMSESNTRAKFIFDKANDVLGYHITNIMFNGTDVDLKQTKVTQSAVFFHLIDTALCKESFTPDMVAGYSLGEFSALVTAGKLTFEDGLRVVYARTMAMQKKTREAAPSTMAAIINLPDETIEQVCAELSEDGQVVVPANYNSPGQVLIFGNVEAIKEACVKLKEAGAKRAFHSPLMELARIELAAAIKKALVSKPICPVYQNVDALPHTNPAEIKDNFY